MLANLNLYDIWLDSVIDKLIKAVNNSLEEAKQEFSSSLPTQSGKCLNDACARLRNRGEEFSKDNLPKLVQLIFFISQQALIRGNISDEFREWMINYARFACHLEEMGCSFELEKETIEALKKDLMLHIRILSSILKNDHKMFRNERQVEILRDLKRFLISMTHLYLA